ncbi:protein-S-isoprenylcysteine O-methyltransferase, putative [Plasmodium gallinaceum]|uniref:Protein-S-isoprenylcysteine O-methyltransferase n=1 Tax=Plasmodium gallinaceum TaxID=5849 RepID=A0A1J1H151_PLAGA|nr:protein-S-isoprenylcysteine O-methyltransferase, putative [Plasmodium gallinaceum]CRG97005.1 protein-S-isoprenylcysteine O-methyltransferase, putative [Plasmodium gallinaceum]
MNITRYVILTFLLYTIILNYKIFIYLINTNLYELMEKKNLYKIFGYYLHNFLDYGFISIYITVGFLPNKNVYMKQSKSNYIFAKILLVYFLFFFLHFTINIFNNFPLNIFYLVITIFHLSEFFLSFLHNKDNHNFYNFLVNPNRLYVYFFICTLIEYYAKIFLFVILSIFEKNINKKFLHKALLFNLFFLKNYIENYGNCSYSYFNAIKVDNFNLSDTKEMSERIEIFKNCKYYNNQIMDIHLSKRKMLKENHLTCLLNNLFIRDTSDKKILLHNNEEIEYNEFKRKTNENYKTTEKYKNIKDNTGIFTYGKCIFGNITFKNIIDKYMDNLFIKTYDLNDSFFQKIILKYKGIFYKYELPKISKKLYNYYLYVILSSLVLSLIGLFLRLFGIIQCSSNFSFYVLSSHSLRKKNMKKEHHLVKKGLYKYMRHPCYTGWFYYSLFLQLFLFNIFCFFLSFIISWAFLYRTIKIEERNLLKCYNEEYRKYKEETPHIYIPFINNI